MSAAQVLCEQQVAACRVRFASNLKHGFKPRKRGLQIPLELTAAEAALFDVLDGEFVSEAFLDRIARSGRAVPLSADQLALLVRLFSLLPDPLDLARVLWAVSRADDVRNGITELMEWDSLTHRWMASWFTQAGQLLASGRRPDFEELYQWRVKATRPTYDRQVTYLLNADPETPKNCPFCQKALIPGDYYTTFEGVDAHAACAGLGLEAEVYQLLDQCGPEPSVLKFSTTTAEGALRRAFARVARWLGVSVELRRTDDGYFLVKVEQK